MKKFFLSFAVIVTFIFYSLHQRLEDVREANTVISPVISSAPEPSSALPVTQGALPAVVQQVNRGQYKNGQFTGDVADAYYGYVQVKAFISGGKITDVQFLQYPNDRRTSVAINSQAMPYLTQEAIQAQHANVDTISGATQTSRAFRESLQSALNKAKV